MLLLRDDTHVTSMKIPQFSRPPTPLPIYVQYSSTHLNLDVQFQTNPPPLSLDDNQPTERKHNSRMIIYVIRSFLQVGLRFQCQFINLVWFSFDFFSLSSSLTICCFVTLYSCVFAIVQKYHEMSFSYNYSHF